MNGCVVNGHEVDLVRVEPRIFKAVCSCGQYESIPATRRTAFYFWLDNHVRKVPA